MRYGIAIVALLALASHVSCLAATGNSLSQTSHLSSVISHITPQVSVTNHAHRVIRGEFGGVTNNTFIVSGRAYPLSILPKGEQRRIRKLAGCDVRTAKEKRIDRARAMHLERIRLREQEGEIDRETADRLRRELESGSKQNSPR